MDHGGNHGAGFFPSHIKTAVDRMHGKCHGKKGQQRGCERTVDKAKEKVVHGHEHKKSKAQQAIQAEGHGSDQKV